jgi:hypothetical protein
MLADYVSVQRFDDLTGRETIHIDRKGRGFSRHGKRF